MNIDEIKERLLEELSDGESGSVTRMMDAYQKMLFTLADHDLSDREAMITLSHTLIRCAKMINGEKDKVLKDIGAMWDMLTLLEEDAEGSIQ